MHCLFLNRHEIEKVGNKEYVFNCIWVHSALVISPFWSLDPSPPHAELLQSTVPCLLLKGKAQAALRNPLEGELLITIMVPDPPYNKQSASSQVAV